MKFISFVKAVIKPNETSQQLVQKASGSVSNDERQVAVMLQLKDFLCNDKNGIPKNWGVIVSGDKYATGKYTLQLNNHSMYGV